MSTVSLSNWITSHYPAGWTTSGDEVGVYLVDASFAWDPSAALATLLSGANNTHVIAGGVVTGRTDASGVADAADIAATTLTGASTSAIAAVMLANGTTFQSICFITLDTPIPYAGTGVAYSITWDNGANRIFTVPGGLGGNPTVTPVDPGGGGAELPDPPVFAPHVPSARIEVWDDANTTYLARVYIANASAKASHPHSELGNLSVDSGEDRDAAPYLVAGNHLRLVIDDVYVYTTLIEDPIERTVVAFGGLANKLIRLTTRGHAAAFELAPVNPWGGYGSKPQSLTRPFTAFSPESRIDDPPWVDVTVLYDEISVAWQTPQTDPPWWKPWLPPKGWPDPDGAWVWSRPIDPDTGHPVGECPFVWDVTIPADGLYQLWIAADDGFIAYVDGIRVGEGQEAPADSFITPWSGCWLFSAGTHRIGILGKNYDRPHADPVGTFGGVNVGRVAWALYSLPQGANTTLTPDLLVAHSDGSGRCIDYPDSLPAPPANVVNATLMDEMAAAGTLVGWSRSFDTDTMTDGSTPAVGEAQYYQNGDDNLLTVIQAQHAAALADWQPEPEGKTLGLWNYGDLGEAKPDVDYDPAHSVAAGEQRLVELKSTSIPIVNSYEVRHRTGTTIVDHPSVAGGAPLRRKPLPLQTLEEVDAVAKATRILEVRAQARESLIAQIADPPNGTKGPYQADGWWPGDTPTVNGDPLRSVNNAITIDRAGRATIVPEFSTRLQSAEELGQILLDKQPGADAREATPLEGMTQGITAGFVQEMTELDWTMEIPSVGGVYSISKVKRVSEPGRAWLLDLTQVTPNSVSPTIINLLRNGDVVGSCTLPVGFYHAQTLLWYVHFSELDALQVECVSCDPATDDDEGNVRHLGFAIRMVKAHPAQVTPRAPDAPWQ
jgi:hypothetical protein